ncbi:hypothetical protein H4218_002583 [Coemansia sp. IMI 209128]|nr:hypothetical protein H4218_002583 [Coemansia sp. IMI 209128]
MASLSPLQTLPLHVVEMIVDHLTANIRQALSKNFGDDREIEQYQRSQTPLLWVCHSLRSVVSERLFKDYELNFDANGDKLVGGTALWMRHLKRFNGPLHLVAKKLTVQVSAWAIYTGKALEVLSSEPHSDYFFPKARTLEIKLVNGPDPECSSVTTEMVENAVAFVRWVWRLAPKLNQTELSSGMSSLDGRSFSNSFHFNAPIAICFDAMATALSRFGRIRISCCVEGKFVFQFMDTIKNLAYLNTNFCYNAPQTMELIRQNASTLKHLVLSAFGVDITGIIQGNGTALAEYPHLETLDVDYYSGWRTPQQRSLDGAAPFPRLQRLICRDNYPFSDELVLFRGNAATLEHLHLPLTQSLANTLIRHGVFTRESHPKLQYVILLPPPGIMEDNGADNLDLVSIDGSDEPDYVQLMLDIAPGAAVRKIYYWAPPQLTPLVLSLFGKHVSLQVLVMPELRLSIWDAMTLIRLLPLLSDLHALAPTLDPLPAGVTSNGLVPYVLSNYSPMAVRFRCWHMEGAIYDKHLIDAVTPVLLLALACPNFDYAAVTRNKRYLFAGQLERAIDKPSFEAFAPRLRRLIPLSGF